MNLRASCALAVLFALSQLGCPESSPDRTDAAVTSGDTATRDAGSDTTTLQDTGVGDTAIDDTSSSGDTSIAVDASDVDTNIADSTADASDIVDGGDAGMTPLERLIADLRGESDEQKQFDRINRFIDSVSYGDGFPLRDGDQVTFVFFDPDRYPGSVYVAGDFSGWKTRPLNQPVAGVPLFIRRVTIPSPKARSKYKFVRKTADGSTWFADPYARMYGYDENGEYALLRAEDNRGHLERWPRFDQSIGTLGPRPLLVYVPPGYQPSNGPYPLLVMHDGQNLFDPSAIHGGWRVDAAADAAINAGEVSPFLVVGIPNTPARMDEYTHVEDDIGSGTVGGRADDYGRFVAKGVVPFVRGEYAVGTSRKRTGILGSSLGGLVSLHVASQHRNLFGHAGSMSGTLAWGEFGAGNPTIIDRYRTNPPSNLSIYLDSGGESGINCQGLFPAQQGKNHDNYCATIAMRDMLVDKGWTRGQDLLYKWDEGASHNEAAWASRFPWLIRNWFPGQ